MDVEPGGPSGAGDAAAQPASPRIAVRLQVSAASTPWPSILIVLLVGLLFLGGGIVAGLQEVDYASDGASTIGIVLDKDVVAGLGDDPDEFVVTYRFDDAAGREFRDGARIDRDTYEALKPDDPIEVTYLRSRPSVSRVAGAPPTWVPILIGGLGAIVVLAGLLLAARRIVGTSGRTTGGPMRGLADDAAGRSQTSRDRSRTTYAFQRPISRVIVDLFGAPLGALLFLGAAWFIGTGKLVPSDGDPTVRFIFPVVFGFFGLLLLTAVPMSFRRGLRRTVLEVGPDGMWTPEMGRLGWSEIAEVRLEGVQGFAGGDHDDSGTTVELGNLTLESRTVDRATDVPMATYRRLGIVPRDPSLVEREHGRVGWRMMDGLNAFGRIIRPSARIQDLRDLAPFGVYAYDLGGSLEGAVRAVTIHRILGPEVRPPSQDEQEASAPPTIAGSGTGPPLHDATSPGPGQPRTVEDVLGGP